MDCYCGIFSLSFGESCGKAYQTLFPFLHVTLHLSPPVGISIAHSRFRGRYSWKRRSQSPNYDRNEGPCICLQPGSSFPIFDTCRLAPPFQVPSLPTMPTRLLYCLKASIVLHSISKYQPPSAQKRFKCLSTPALTNTGPPRKWQKQIPPPRQPSMIHRLQPAPYVSPTNAGRPATTAQSPDQNQTVPAEDRRRDRPLEPLPVKRVQGCHTPRILRDIFETIRS